MSREAAYGALFAKLQTLLTAGTVKTCNRHLKLMSEVPAGDMPALYMQVDHQDVAAELGSRLPPKRTLGARVLVYAAPPDSYTTTGIQLNAIVDAIEGALAPASPLLLQDLGGVVHDCKVAGQVEIYEGPLGQQGAAIVPIQMIVP